MGMRNVYAVRNGKVVLAKPRKRLYVGVNSDLTRETFWSAETPTETSHGHLYACAIGPFRTKTGAEYMRDYGQGNPHCRCVADAERLAQFHKDQSMLCRR